jgi:small subunit ribosomal protein S6
LETAVKKLYEAMFLVDSTQASDWDKVVKIIETVLKRSDAEIVAIRNWAERKLAYDIDHKSRGAYALCFFRADGSSIPNIEKDVQLSEQILRVLILSTGKRHRKRHVRHAG